MASKYTKLLRSIWTNPDFIALNAAEQRTFMMLFSQPDITAAGVLPFMERRWARYAADTDADSVRASLHVLATCPQPFIVIDEGTDEVWVRSYLAVDELFRVPNGRKAIDAALSAVASSLIRPQIERVYRTLVETLSRTDGSPQQQAASSEHHSPDTDSSSQQPDTLSAAAAAAIEIYVTHRITTEQGVRKPERYAAKIRTDEIRLHAHQLSNCDPNRDPIDLAVELFDITRPQALTAAGVATSIAWCSSSCPQCEGTGWIDTGAGMAPCPERTAAA